MQPFEETTVDAAGDSVGVGSEPGGFGKHVQCGKQSQPSVHTPGIVTAVAANVGKFQCHETQDGIQPAQGVGAGILGVRNEPVDAVLLNIGKQAQDPQGVLGNTSRLLRTNDFPSWFS